MLSAEAGSSTSDKLKCIILGLGTYFFPVNALPNKNHTMRSRMRKTQFKVRRYAACMIDMNKYFSVFPGGKSSDKCFDTELNENLLNRMTNSWSNQKYVQGFDCKTISFKAALNMFECM